MAKYLVEDTSLTAVADAIRTKTGSSEPLAFPEGFVEAVAGIAAGGGSCGIATGTIIPAESIKGPFEIVHDLGEVPHIAICYLESDEPYIRDETVVSGTHAFSYSINGTYSGVAYKTGSGITSELSLDTMATNAIIINHAHNESSPNVICSANQQTAELYTLRNSSLKFNAGNKYRWIMISKEVSN